MVQKRILVFGGDGNESKGLFLQNQKAGMAIKLHVIPASGNRKVNGKNWTVTADSPTPGSFNMATGNVQRVSPP
jgi:hypothetical protein